MIKQGIQRGPYQTVDEFVRRAISLLHQQEACLAEPSTEIGLKIERGYAVAQRGEWIDSDQVRSWLDERKRAWLAEKRQARAVTNVINFRWNPSPQVCCTAPCLEFGRLQARRSQDRFCRSL